jgi:hypothetical protein
MRIIPRRDSMIALLALFLLAIAFVAGTAGVAMLSKLRPPDAPSQSALTT